MFLLLAVGVLVECWACAMERMELIIQVVLAALCQHGQPLRFPGVV